MGPVLIDGRIARVHLNEETGALELTVNAHGFIYHRTLSLSRMEYRERRDGGIMLMGGQDAIHQRGSTGSDHEESAEGSGGG